jgi:hypothetical protein
MSSSSPWGPEYDDDELTSSAPDPPADTGYYQPAPRHAPETADDGRNHVHHPFLSGAWPSATLGPTAPCRLTNHPVGIYAHTICLSSPIDQHHIYRSLPHLVRREVDQIALRPGCATSCEMC